MKKVIKVLFSLYIILCGACLLVYNSETITAISDAITRCVTTVFPSLFGFMIVTTFLLESGICSYISKPLVPISKYVFGMDSEIFTVFLFSMIGGYPSGANLVRRLYESNKISKCQANVYSSLFYCGGPAFIFGLYGNILGKYVFLSVLISNIIVTLFVNNLFFRNKVESKSNKNNLFINVNVFADSINSSFVVLSKVCAMIVAFGFLTVLIHKIVPLNIIYPYIEISTIANISISPILASTMFSFGGLCVILQIKTILKDLFDAKMFIIIRVIISILSGIIMSIFMKFVPDASIMTSVTIKTSESYQYGYLPIVFCIIMSILLLLLSERKSNSKT